MKSFTPDRESIVIPIAIGVTGLASMTAIAQLLHHKVIPVWKFSDYSMVNHTVTMQLMVLPISFIALVLLRFNYRDGFKTFFRWGMRSSEHEWGTYGPVTAIALTIGTILLMFMGVKAEHGVMNETFFALLPIVFFVSATNAWSEEIFSRFALASGLSGKLSPNTICLISGIIFGLPHYFGTPGGVFGVIVTGALGWLLMRSVLETRGLGWAWMIHFLQDIIIFGAGAMILAGN